MPTRQGDKTRRTLTPAIDATGDGQAPCLKRLCHEPGIQISRYPTRPSPHQPSAPFVDRLDEHTAHQMPQRAPSTASKAGILYRKLRFLGHQPTNLGHSLVSVHRLCENRFAFQKRPESSTYFGDYFLTAVCGAPQSLGVAERSMMYRKFRTSFGWPGSDGPSPHEACDRWVHPDSRGQAYR